jgi:glycosyltransferase involved in cell wall biosynthesis
MEHFAGGVGASGLKEAEGVRERPNPMPKQINSDITLAVLVTYHNEASLLTECLESLRRAGRLPDEILLYDDASDVPPEAYIPPSVPVRVITGRENRGPAHARNVLLEASSCEYVHFHDSDDWFHPEWCSAVRGCIQSSHADAVFTELAAYDDGVLGTDSMMKLGGMADDLLAFALQVVLQTPSGTYRRDKVLNIGGYSDEISQSEDYDFHIRLAGSGISFAVIDRALVNVRIRPGSRSQDRVRLHADAVKVLEKRGIDLPERYRPMIAECLALRGASLYKLRAYREAKHAFQAAYVFGKPSFDYEHGAYRSIAKLCGPLVAERCGRIYRGLVPLRMRSMVRFGSTC